MGQKPPKSPKKRPASARKQRLQAAIVEASVIHKSLSAVARDEGVSRRTVTREAAGEDVRQVITLLVASRWERVNALYDLALDAIEGGLTARAHGVTKDGEVYTLGKDHYAQLTAVSRFNKLITSGRPVPKPIDGEGKQYEPSWADFKALMERHSPKPLGKS